MSDVLPDTLGDFIRKSREHSDQFGSLRQFAIAINKSPSWVSKVERNIEIPGIESIFHIATVLRANPDELLQRAGKIDPDLERQLILRFSEIAPLLRIVILMTSEQIKQLQIQAVAIQKEGSTKE